MIKTLATLAAIASLSCTAPVAAAQKMVVGYAPNWNDANALINSVDFTKLTHIDVAFENPIDATGAFSYNANDDLLIAKAHASNVKALLSIGGGSASEDKSMKQRYFELQTDAKRAGFVAKIVAMVNDHKFDGLDVDLEGDSIGKDYGAFIEDLAAALTPSGKLLTAAVSEGNGGDRIPNRVIPLFSFLNIMAYDATGPWNKNVPGQHSSMAFTTATVDYWIGRGLQRSKAVVGVPFYGYGFGPAYRDGDYSFSEIVGTYPGAESLDQVGTTIWYNGIPTIKAKAKYVVDQGLGGMMIWSLGADAKGEKSLLSALYDGLNPKK